MADEVVKQGLDWITGIGTTGGLGVFIYLVRLFLGRQKESEAAQAAQREQHSKDQKEMRDSFTSVVTIMGERFSSDLKETRETFTTQVTNLTDKFYQQHEAQMRVNQETVSALTGLRGDVQELKEKVK